MRFNYLAIKRGINYLEPKYYIKLADPTCNVCGGEGGVSGYNRDEFGSTSAYSWICNCVVDAFENELEGKDNWLSGSDVRLTEPYLSEERYNEDEVVMPAGMIGTIIEAEQQGDAWGYYVEFTDVLNVMPDHEDVTLFVWPEQLESAA